MERTELCRHKETPRPPPMCKRLPPGTPVPPFGQNHQAPPHPALNLVSLPLCGPPPPCPSPRHVVWNPPEYGICSWKNRPGKIHLPPRGSPPGLKNMSRAGPGPGPPPLAFFKTPLWSPVPFRPSPSPFAGFLVPFPPFGPGPGPPLRRICVFTYIGHGPLEKVKVLEPGGPFRPSKAPRILCGLYHAIGYLVRAAGGTPPPGLPSCQPRGVLFWCPLKSRFGNEWT